MRRPCAAHVVPALPDFGPAVKPAESESFGERYAEPEVLGLSIALHAVDEIGCCGGGVFEPEGVRVSPAATSAGGRSAMAEENASCTGAGGRNAAWMLGNDARAFFRRTAKGLGSLSEVRINPVKRSAG